MRTCVRTRALELRAELGNDQAVVSGDTRWHSFKKALMRVGLGVLSVGLFFADVLSDIGVCIELYRTGSVVGYCMLPMCLLAALAVALPGGLVTGVVAGVLVTWCTSKATAQFMRSLPQSSEGKRLVVAYPCFTLYCLFALLSAF